jgi:hypothetical protein
VCKCLNEQEEMGHNGIVIHWCVAD